MMGVKIWKRYFFWETFKVFAFLLFCIYLLFVLIDYSTHSQSFAKADFGLADIGRYYSYHFLKRVDFLAPLALLLAFIRTSTAFNAHNELVALLAGGVPLRKLMQPFMILGIICATVLYLLTETVMPRSLLKMQEMEDASFRKIEKSEKDGHLKEIALEDGSTLIYQSYNSAEKVFFDVYWLRDENSFFHMKYLYPHAEEPLGQFVDYVERDKYGALKLERSDEAWVFKNLQLNPDVLIAALIRPKHQSISQLAKAFPRNSTRYSDKEAQLVTAFFHKLMMPLLCILVIMGPAPACTRFGRSLPLFSIYSIAIFSFIAFYTMIDSAQILGRNQVLSPFWAIGGPFFIAFIICGYRYRKLA